MSRRLIALNNTGLENLRSGRFNEAISSFAHALECAKDLVDCHQEKQVMSLPEIPLFQCSMDFSNAIDLFALSPNNMFDVYKFGFALPKDPSTVRSANDVLFVIIFNMALTHHLAGLCFNRAANMSEALKYYKLTFASYHVSSSCRSGDAFLVLLGCVVNMGHIFSHFWRTQEVQACFDTLENLLDSPDVTTLSEQDGHFFFALLAYGETLSLNVAAAA